MMAGEANGGASEQHSPAADPAVDGLPPPAGEAPRSLRAALRGVNREAGGPATPSDTASEEDYDELTRKPTPVTLLIRRRNGAAKGTAKPTLIKAGAKADIDGTNTPSELTLATDSSFESLDLKPLKVVNGAGHPNTYVLSADDEELRRILRESLRHVKEEERRFEGSGGGSTQAKRRGKFTDLVFTRNFSTFDRQNTLAASSPFYGFFTLFWISVFLFVVKIGADNWRRYGHLLGNNEIMQHMFRRDVLVLLLADGVMCGVTGVSWLLQRLILAGVVDWDHTGWLLQNLWQLVFIGSVVGLTLVRDWPWSHTVFFVLHGLVMLMKQHSYAFYNGYLSTAYKKRNALLVSLKQLERVHPVQSPSRTEPPVSAISTSHLAFAPSAAEMKERRASGHATQVLQEPASISSTVVSPDDPQWEQSSSQEQQAHQHQAWQRRRSLSAKDDVDRIVAAIESESPLDAEQIEVFERMMRWEADALADDLRGKAARAERAYPHNLTFLNHYEYIVLPTVVYELEYPRSESINWYYAAEKMVACFGIILVMIMVSQAFIYPVVMETVRMKEMGMPLAERFRAFPWMLSDLIFPFMMEYMLSWYLIWETILNFLAELTYFADRSFYDAWWNSVSWDQFARDWNRPVHNFLLRHVYHSSISALKVNKHTATLITFFLSACVHELVMWCIFKKLRGYLLVLQMCQLPLVALSRTRWLKNQATLGNVIFWLGIFTGPSVLCSLYLIL